MVCGGLSFYPYARPGAGNPPRSLASPVPGTVEAMVEVPSATTNADSPELMAEVMVTIPARVQVGMSKAVMEGVFPRSVAIAVTAATGSAEVVELGPIGVSPGTTSSAGPELELELIQSHMAQNLMLRGEVGARALRVRSDVRGHGQVRLCKALGGPLGEHRRKV